MVFIKKSTFFLYVFFSKKSKKEIFLVFFNRKECVLDLKSEVLAKSKKKSTFCKGVSPWFFSTNRTFFHIFFVEPRKPEKNIFCYFGWKGMLFGAQKKSSQKL